MEPQNVYGGLQGYQSNWVKSILLLLFAFIICLPTQVFAANNLPKTINTVTPPAIRIDLFNYQLDPNQPTSITANNGKGINANHALRFVGGFKDSNRINQWRKGESVPGIVQNTLLDGYPVLNPSVAGSNESLAYLFNPAIAHPGKDSYSNVAGLLAYNTDAAQYYYDCNRNFASYDVATNSFKVFDMPGAKYFGAINSGELKQEGQFFPFLM